MKKQQTSPSCFVLLLIYLFTFCFNLCNYLFIIKKTKKPARSDLILHAAVSMLILFANCLKYYSAFGGLGLIFLRTFFYILTFVELF